MSTAEGGANIVRNGLVLYLDGSNYKSIISGDTTWNDIEKFPSYNMTLTNGAASDLGGSNAMAGNIASVKIYNRVLTPQEVAQNYNALKPRFSY